MWLYAVGAGSVAVAAWGLYRYGAPLYLLMLAVPVFAWYASRVLVHGGFEGASWLRRKHFEEWHGRYYHFAHVHLRASDLDGALVFVEDDLLAVIHQPESTAVTLFGPAERVTLPDSGMMALTEAGCERLLMKCPHREAKKLLLFLRRECFGPFAKRGGFGGT